MTTLQQRTIDRKNAYKRYLWNRIKTDRQFGHRLADYHNKSTLFIRRAGFRYAAITPEILHEAYYNDIKKKIMVATTTIDTSNIRTIYHGYDYNPDAEE